MFPYSSKVNNGRSCNGILFPLYSESLAPACGIDFSKYLKLSNYRLYL